MKTLADRLGVKTDSRVLVAGVSDAVFIQELKARAAAVQERKVEAECDLIIYAVQHKDDLDMLSVLGRYLTANGALWVVYPKGRQELMKKHDVMTAGRKAGLVDRNTVRFSDTHTALKFVAPLRKRRQR